MITLHSTKKDKSLTKAENILSKNQLYRFYFCMKFVKMCHWRKRALKKYWTFRLILDALLAKYIVGI